MKKILAYGILVFAVGSILIFSGRDLSVFSAYTPAQMALVDAYLSVPTTTTVTTANNWYPVQGVFTNNIIEGWSFDTDHIEYDFNKPRCHLFTWVGVFTADQPITTVHITLGYNGVPQTSRQVGTIAFSSDNVYSITGTAVIEISADDEIQLIVMSDGDGDEITFNHFTTQAISLGP